MNQLPAHLRAIVERQGVDAAALAELSDAPGLNPAGWKLPDPHAWLTETVDAQLRAAVPKLFYDATIFDDDGTAGTNLRGWVSDHLAQPQRYPWLLLNGLTGRGKSHLGWATLMAIVRAHSEHGRRLSWRHTDQVAFNDEVRVKPDQSHAYARKKYLDAQLLFFDDIGAGSPSEFNAEATLQIINHRYENKLATIYASNLGRTDLTTLLGDRVYSRLTEAARIIVDGPDRRATRGWKP
jgi:hypothetical protein